MMAAVAGAVAPTPSPAVDVAPVLTSTPFGALPGQRVTHTVTISGGGALTAARVTFTTTADLDGVTARAEPGRCAVSARTVVCDLGDLRLAAGSPAPQITITGRMGPGTPPGTLIRNRVSVASAQSTATGAAIASNAYLLPGSAPTAQPRQESQAATRVQPPARSRWVTAVAAVVVAGAVAAAALLTRRRLRRRRAQPGSPRRL